MVRPAAFGFNPQTAGSNAFQSSQTPPANLANRAQREFDSLVKQLRSHGVCVRVFDEPIAEARPDAVFPNNWVSFHRSAGRVFLYPMMAPSRRDERHPEWISSLVADWPSVKWLNLSAAEREGRFLEGTGSLIFDPVLPYVYAGISQRTHVDLAHQVADELGLTLVFFDTADAAGQAVYHTNVLMGVGRKLAMGSWKAVRPNNRRKALMAALTECDRLILELSMSQMDAFAGNWIELQGSDNALFVTGKTAWNALKDGQKTAISQLYTPVIADVSNIETWGGGSVRCMICTVD